MEQEFEYTIRQLDWSSVGLDEDEEVQRLLNAYAARGWEYLHTVVPHTGAPVTVFRRRLA
jgi:hypothetical protein